MTEPLSAEFAPIPVSVADTSALCRSCGACCAYSAEWPRFALEDDATLALIPPAFVDDRRGGMRCIGDRCSALTGTVGVATSCAVHAMRPDVCRACMPGDAACGMARQRFGLGPVAWMEQGAAGAEPMTAPFD